MQLGLFSNRCMRICCALLGLYLASCQDPENLEIEMVASVTSGLEPLSVNFGSDASGGVRPYTYDWDFGDEETASVQNITHVYQDAGVYRVTVQVTDDRGETARVSQSIEVIANADLDFAVSASPTEGVAPLTVSFGADVLSGETPLTFFWNFGDSTNSIEQMPTHVYTRPGLYTATLRVTDGTGDYDSARIEITVQSGADAQSIDNDTETAEVNENSDPNTTIDSDSEN